jgi:hypothetical protein
MSCQVFILCNYLKVHIKYSSIQCIPILPDSICSALYPIWGIQTVERRDSTFCRTCVTCITNLNRTMLVAWSCLNFVVTAGCLVVPKRIIPLLQSSGTFMLHACPHKDAVHNGGISESKKELSSAYENYFRIGDILLLLSESLRYKAG